MAAHCARAIYTVAEYTIVFLLAAAALLACLGGLELHAAFALGNAVFLAYAITSFIGFGNGWQDVRPALPGFTRRTARKGGRADRARYSIEPLTSRSSEKPVPISRQAWRAYAPVVMCRE